MSPNVEGPSIPRDLQADLSMLRTVLTHAQKREWNRARPIAENALASGFEHPLLLNVVATCLEQEGRFEEALRLLERALELAPRDLGVRNALALCLQRLDRPAEALLHLDELLKEHPGLDFLHASKGNALIAMGHLGRAQASHLKAVELQPNNIAAMASLASIASHRGSHDEARGWAERVLAAVPNFPDAMLAIAAAELACGATERAETLLRQLLADPRVAPTDRARAYGLLGDVLDAAGRYVEAFAAYTTCNEALQQSHLRFANRTSLIAYTRALSAALERVHPETWGPRETTQAVSGDPAGHVFLIGFPRSGTTLLEVVLDGHPKVSSLDENELFIDSVRHFLREPVDLKPLERASESELARWRAAYWERVRRAGVNAAGKVFVDKYPMNTLKLPLIARLFPRAKILFACRDPRDVVLGCFRRRFRMNAAMYELLTLQGGSALYDETMRFAQKLQPTLAEQWRVVRYESLMADFTPQLRAICDFIGLEWVEGMDDFGPRARTREHATPSTAQLARGLDRSGIGHWKHYAAALQPVMPTLNSWVERLGYSAESVVPQSE